MKNLYIKILFCFITLTSLGQSIERQVIASSGETLTNNGVTLDFTIGELAVTTITDNTTILTQGFHQGTILLGIKIDPIVFLQGALLSSGNTNLMRDNLRSFGFIPTTSPYSDGAICNASVFNSGGTSGTGITDDNIVDWVWIELRDANDNTNVVDGKSALLQKDGDVVALDGITTLEFNVPSKDYFIAIKHRNHLAVISQSAFTLTNQLTTVDFTKSASPITYGTNAQKDFNNGVLALWAGDASGNGQIRFLGPGNDLNNLKGFILSDPGNTTGSASYPVTGYSDADINLNGQARFLGPGNDNNILKSIILSNPANTSGSISYPISQQIPN